MEREEFLRRFEDITNVMDNEIREALHSKIAPCSEFEFLLAYVAKDLTILSYIESEHKAIVNLLS